MENIALESSIVLGVLGTILGIVGVTIASLAYEKANDPDTIDITAIFLRVCRFFVFRPGFTGSAVGIYTDWTVLYTDLVTIHGPAEIFFDGSDGTITIPSGFWDMTNVEWTGPMNYASTSPLFTNVNVADGATFKNLSVVNGALKIVYNSSTQPSMVRTLGDIQNPTRASFSLRNGSALACTGSQPFILVSDGALTVLLDDFSSFFQGGVIQSVPTTSGQGLLVFVGSLCTIGDNTVFGVGNITFTQQDLTATISQTQTSATGTVLFLDNVGANNMLYTAATIGDWSGTNPSSVANALDRIAAAVGPIA